MSANYVVRIIKFVCVDESGFDFIASDEPMWVFTAKGTDGKVHTTRSKEFSDIDSGNSKLFLTDNDRNIVWPQKGAVNGAPGPIGLAIQLWEMDQGDPDEVERKTQEAFDLATQAPVIGDWVDKVPSVVREKIASFIGNDLMGSKTLFFPESRLASRLTKKGDSFLEKHRFGGNGGDLPFEVAGGPDYDLFIRIIRVS